MSRMENPVALKRSMRTMLPKREGSPALDGLWRDVRVAARSLAKRPGFLLVATLSLSVGIGANTAIFSVVNAVFIKQYPYRASDELVHVYTHVPRRTEYGTTSYPNYKDIKEFNEVFQAVGAYKTILSRVEIRGEAVRALGEAVSQTLFPMLGLDACLGRTFLPEEDQTPGAHRVVMLGYGFWQQAFGGDPGVIGTPIRIAGQPFTVVGIAPEGFHGLSGAGLRADFFVPLVMYGTACGMTDHSHFDDRLDRRYSVVGRLAEGMTLKGARAGIQVLADRIRAAHPEIDQGWAFTMIPLADVALDPEVDSALEPFAILLMAAGALVLLLACTNLASFLLTRGVSRRKETALRLALGAGRGALVRQALTETALMGLLGGAAGLLVARWTLSLLVRIQPPLSVPFFIDLAFDLRVLLFTLGLAAIAGLLLGAAPALQSTRLDLAPILRGGMGQPLRNRRFGLRNGLIALQMALSVVLLVGGGLSIRSLGAARDADLGFSTRNAGIAWVDLSVSGLSRAEYAAAREELTQRARALPGIEAVTSATHIPFFGSASGGFYTIPGAEPPAEGRGYNVQREEVDADFFSTMGIPVVAGRAFTEGDRPGSQRVAIVNETAAGWFWPGEDPVGREFFPLESDQGFQVVGVVGDTKIERLREPRKPLFYFPISQAADPDLILVARGRPAPEDITRMLRRMIREVNPALMVMETKTMEDNIAVILFPARMAALLLGVFGVLALALAAIGLYGVVSFSVSQRTREIGIRMSVGANARAVVLTVMAGAMQLVAVGGFIGLAAALGLAQLLRHTLFGVDSVDIATLLAVPLILACAAGVAAWIPARRAGRVDPMVALRYE
jgi:predicted permease